MLEPAVRTITDFHHGHSACSTSTFHNGFTSEINEFSPFHQKLTATKPDHLIQALIRTRSGFQLFQITEQCHFCVNCRLLLASDTLAFF